MADVRIWSTENEEYVNELFDSVSDAWTRVDEFACSSDACSSEWEIDDITAGVTHSLDVIENDDGEFENYENCERPFDREARFYVIERKYVGPNGRKPIEVTIALNPGLTEPGNSYISEGWLGTRNDWQRTALGEFTTYVDALARAKATVGDDYWTDYEPDDNSGIVIMTEEIDEAVAA